MALKTHKNVQITTEKTWKKVKVVLHLIVHVIFYVLSFSKIHFLLR